jgi:hypothetical protein
MHTSVQSDAVRCKSLCAALAVETDGNASSSALEAGWRAQSVSVVIAVHWGHRDSTWIANVAP